MRKIPLENMAAHLAKQLVPGPNGCLLWTGYVDAKGYGKTNIHRRAMGAHRAVYLFAHGSIPKGMHIDHICRVHACCNIEHLEAVTQAENIRRGHYGVLFTHCKQGHEMAGANVRQVGGRRHCRKCQAIRSREYKARRAA